MHKRDRNFLRLVALLVVSASLNACKVTNPSHQGHIDVQGANSNAHYRKLDIQNDAVKNGIFDVSVEYGDDGTGWIAYSRVGLPAYVETGLAKSTNHGESWQYVLTVNPSINGHFNDGNETHIGVWRYETPSLLYDPDDHPSHRWKLFTQKYLSVPPYKKGNSLFQYGQIEYKYASDPKGPWSGPVCLFGSVRNACKVNLAALDNSLSNIVFYNEIGTVMVNGVIYLSVDASPTSSGLGDWEQRKIVLFASSDHGETWNYVNTLTSFADAGDFGYLALTGSSLVQEGKHVYLLVTPTGKKGLFVKNRAHDGVYVIQFDAIGEGKLKRDAKGRLIISKQLNVEPGMHSGGLADYDVHNTAGGILFSQISINKKHRPEFFQVFSTGSGLH